MGSVAAASVRSVASPWSMDVCKKADCQGVLVCVYAHWYGFILQ